MEYHTKYQNTARPSKASQRRKYLGIILVMFALSLLLSPPTLGPGNAGAAGRGGDDVETQAELIVRLGQNLGLNGETGVAVKDLRTGETVRLADDREFDAASTMKLVFLTHLYSEANAGNIDLDDELNIPAGQIQRYGTGSIQYQPGPHRYTYRKLAELMIKESDNTAAFVLAERLGKDELQTYAESNGMNKTSIERNTTTASDLLVLLEKLHRGELANPELTSEMLGFMQDTEFEDRLPADLPKDAVVSHKTGDAGGGLSDAGIVSYRERSYAVVIFAHGMGDKEKVVPKMAEASKDIFSYLTR